MPDHTGNSRSKAPCIKPWWLHDLENPDEKKLLRDLVSAHRDLSEASKGFKDTCLQHIALYKGLSIEKEIHKRGRLFRDSEGTAGYSRFNNLIVNHLRDVTDSSVSRLAAVKSAATVLPNHGVEFADKAKAKITGSWIDSFSYENNMDDLRRKFQTIATICGECYTLVEWDERKGDIHPAAKKLKKTIDIETEDGSTKVSQLKRVGDVSLRNILPFRVFPEPTPTRDYDRSEWVFMEEPMLLETVKVAYPKKAKELTPSDKHNEDDDALYLASKETSNEVLVITLFHKATPEVPKGRLIRFTADVLLENIELPYSHGELPLRRITSIDVPGESRGMSPYHDLKALQAAINTLYAIMIRDRSLASPKLMVPSGSVDPSQQASNKPGVIQYKGGVPPKWSVPNMVAGDLMVLIDRLEDTFEKLSNSSGTRRGEGIPNVEAFKAFGFFEEQATKRESTSIAKHRDFLQELYKFIVWTAADFYTKSDERMIRMLGKHNQYLLKSFDVEDLKHSYDIRVQNTSALPDSKAARISTIIQLNQAFPDLFTQEKIADMLDLSSDDAFFDLATAAINSAEAENEEILSGVDVLEPQPFEDLLQHWLTHIKQLNSPAIKATLPQEGALASQAINAIVSGASSTETNSPALLLIKHVNTTESIMYSKALQNPKFAQRLSALEAFPVFFKLPMTISEVLQSHIAPLQEPLAENTGVDQEIVLPEAQPPSNPQDLAQ